MDVEFVTQLGEEGQGGGSARIYISNKLPDAANDPTPRITFWEMLI